MQDTFQDCRVKVGDMHSIYLVHTGKGWAAPLDLVLYKILDPLRDSHFELQLKERPPLLSPPMEKLILKAEASLRFCCLMFSVLAACLVGFDKQTKQVFFTVTRTATYRSLGALETLAIVEAVVAGYHLVQLAKCAILVRLGDCTNWCRPCFSWVCFLLDQVTAYVSLAVTSAATQASILAITGAGVFQWSKVCHIYTRFCDQIGGGIGAALIAAAIAAALASLSAFRLFRLFSPNRYFALKEKRVARASPAAA